MRVPVCAIAGLLCCIATCAAAQADCTFNQRAVATELAQRAQRVPGAEEVSPQQYRWTEPDGTIISIRYGGCDDLGAEVSIARGSGRTQPLTRADLVHAVTKYWSSDRANALAKVLAHGPGTARPGSHPHAVDFPADANGLFPFGFTLVRATGRLSVHWREL